MSRLTQDDLDEIRENAESVDRAYVNGEKVDHDARVLAGYTLELLDEALALRAALDAVAAALRPALEAEAGATGGEWRATNGGGGLARRPVWHLVDAGERGPVVCRTGTENMPRAKGDAALIAASVNAVRALAALPAVRAALEGVSL